MDSMIDEYGDCSRRSFIRTGLDSSSFLPIRLQREEPPESFVSMGGESVCEEFSGLDHCGTFLGAWQRREPPVKLGSDD